MQINSITHKSIPMISLKKYTLARFEPDSSDPEADAMSTAPRRQGRRQQHCFGQVSSVVIADIMSDGNSNVDNKMLYIHMYIPSCHHLFIICIYVCNLVYYQNRHQSNLGI
jgi:hypothetical protein